MCGIAGILGGDAGAETVTSMVRTLSHRGPDDEGIWVDTEAGIALGHRRLSVVDLSHAGHQPMISHAGRYVITFNGEIYNHLELRGELAAGGKKIEWSGHSDTETLLAAFDAWGFGRTLQRATGMFALALWDRQERVLILARDRLGEKPLYYGRQNGPRGPFLFASELKALRRHPSFTAEIDRRALALFVRYLDVPAPLSIYRGIFKLRPGTFLTLRHGAEQPEITEYWAAAEVARKGLGNPVTVPADEAADELGQILERAVGRQMMADVPLGAFLSGGVDSSTIVAVMQKLSARPVKTFTIGFHEQGYDEARHAAAVARHLGTEHHELYVTPRQAMDVIPRLPQIYDEPFADSSQIPTFLVSSLARKEVTVALSGDGGDELFGGYDRYLITSRLWDRISGIPNPLRAAGARALTLLPASAWTRLADGAGTLMPRAIRFQRFGDKVHKGAGMLTSQSLDELYDNMLSLWPASGVVVGAPATSLREPADERVQSLRGVERMMAHDMLGYLANDILVKVDRASMAVSLETRVPLLDPEVVEYAWRLPLGMKIRGSSTKWLLRQVLYRHVPAPLIDRPKMGFGIPLDSWLRGPLRSWAESLLDEQRLRDEGYFDAQAVRRVWAGHLNGQGNQYKIWTILMFQSWLDGTSSM